MGSPVLSVCGLDVHYTHGGGKYSSAAKAGNFRIISRHDMELNPMTTDSTKIRVRFAPSPTGYLHIGSARAALFNWLYARHMGGTFLLRIEDTDLERSTEEATQQILTSLDWLGLTPDEPVVYQRQRADRHKEYLDRLLTEGKAYKCYCPKERLEELRGKARTDGRIFAYNRAMLEPGEMEKYEAAGGSFVIRILAPEGETTGFDDMVYGRIDVENANIGDFVIARGDGSPLYNFTNVVDDIDMGITHICRGEDHVSNTPKQMLIYNALGATPPRFAHLPLILGPDKQKLSKRHGATGVMEFKEKGILPQALVNYLSLLGWAPPEAEFNEIMPLDEIVSKFSLDRVKKSPAVFDHEKLQWMNGMYIREMPKSKIYELVIPTLKSRFAVNSELASEEWLHSIIDLAIERSRTLSDFADNLSYFFEAPAEYEEKASKKFLGNSEQISQFVESAGVLDNAWAATPTPTTGPIDEWCGAMEAAVRTWSDARGYKFGNVMQPIRLALTGRTASPSLFHVMALMGREEVARRISACATRLSATAQ
ncbi:MAG: glutamate--tRNA ligase [Candidatus Sumerlaeaceae bacterium]|nr:glutamate--tRNA ligase [Candidatus Sumerlaeaceae bacterium]